jgi:hypothetical protein
VKQELMVKTTQSNNLDNALFLRLTSKQLPILKSDCSRGNQISIKYHPDKIDCAVQIFKVIVDSADIYYGIRSGQLSEALTDKVVKTILSDFNELSVSDIEYAYERFRKEKNDWRNITFDELIQPIKQYHKIKYAVTKERLQMQKEIKEKNERDEKDREFTRISQNLYEESLKSSDMFLGDVFHARKIYGNLLGRIDENILSDFQREANFQSNELSMSNPYLHLSHTPERIYAKMVVDYGIANKMPLNLK